MPSAKYDDDHNSVIDNNSVFSESFESDNESKYVDRIYYPTRMFSKIVNAENGMTYSFNQGSYYELSLYKMTDVRGVYDENGYKIKKFMPPNKDPIFLYYDSPEQCMRHQGIKLPRKTIERWHREKTRMFGYDGVFKKDEWEKIKLETYIRTNKRIS